MNTSCTDVILFTRALDSYNQTLQLEAKRHWACSFLTMLAGSTFLLCGMAYWPRQSEILPASPPPAAIAVELAPLPTHTPAPPSENPPGPQQTKALSTPALENPPKISAPPSPALHPPVRVPKPAKIQKPVRKSKTFLKTEEVTKDNKPPAETTTSPAPSEAPPAQQQASPHSASSSSDIFRTISSWQSALLAQLEKFKRYPAQAMSRHQEGIPTVRFSMDRQGHVITATLSQGSDYKMLDEEALSLPQRAQPLPPPPDDIKGDIITLTVPIEFTIHKD
ncbi:energy transducer TonB [Acetobacteraceae bacterium ESL0709]|nr:energy transducer TonB [Acetobacteraceae bacterium ESL0697]MDF7677963.1 energy transducer TonB [Acetobacteraceae bacterium ESL0709]